uniref:LIM zinc-binding domain-containing protein n=1 Tax=Gopherus evgoodei TaxID=1825980 RepID=A0A8C4WBS9_9SAUR
MSDALANAVCERCQARFDPSERIVNSNGELYHENCFVCAQCFRQFPDGLFYEVRCEAIESFFTSPFKNPILGDAEYLWLSVNAVKTESTQHLTK